MNKDDLDLISGNSNQEFKLLINQKTQDLFWQILSYLEITFPHKPGDGSDNEKTYNFIRSKILRVGNDSIRSNDDLFKSFVVFKVYEYKPVKKESVITDIYTFKDKYKIIKKGEEGQNGNQKTDNAEKS